MNEIEHLLHINMESLHTLFTPPCGHTERIEDGFAAGTSLHERVEERCVDEVKEVA